VYKLNRFYLIFTLFFLVSCQQTEESTEGNNNYNRTNAANYNTQLGLAYLKQGDRPRAKKKLLLALKEAPNSANVNASMAYYLEKAGEYKEAETYYHKAINLSGSSGAQLNNFGTYLCRRGSYREAEKYFLKAVKDIQYEHTAGAYENAGFCVLEIPDKAKAATYFRKALEQDPDRKQSLYELLAIELEQNHLKEGINEASKYKASIENDPALLALATKLKEKAQQIDLQNTIKMNSSRESFSENVGEK
jgi:type IV pilus assembly protein PilF